MRRKKRGNRGNTPRRKRMRRDARLNAGKQWLANYAGKSAIRGYSKWFGVSKLCAASELQLLGVHVEPSTIEQLRKQEQQLGERRKQRAAAKREEESYFDDCEWECWEF